MEALKKNKSLVEQYRDQLAELTIERDDLTHQLREAAAATSQLRGENASLSAGQQERLVETRTLAEELQMAQQQLERGRGIGEGFTELNPTVKQELERLRTENKLLKERLQLTSIESVELMETQFADQRCIAYVRAIM